MATLERALESLRLQTYRNWELIVVDDASTDRSVDLIAAWSSKHGVPVRMYSTATSGSRAAKPVGVSRARNLGAVFARGDWLAFLDSDDEWFPEKLEKQMALAGDYRIIHGDEIWIRNGVVAKLPKRYAKNSGRIFNRCVEVCALSPSTVMIRKDLFDEHAGFDSEFPVCEDFALWLKICAREEVGLIPEPVIRKYGGHGDQLSFRYKAQDYFRVKALVPMLDSTDISEEERRQVLESILKRCEILKLGFLKHGLNALVDAGITTPDVHVEEWRRITNHKAHSAADLRPRSESSFIP